MGWISVGMGRLTATEEASAAEGKADDAEWFVVLGLAGLAIEGFFASVLSCSWLTLSSSAFKSFVFF
jgi:hypothetical protein